MAVRDVGMALWRQRSLVALVLVVAGAALATSVLLYPHPDTRLGRWLVGVAALLGAVAVATVAAVLRDRRTRTVDDAMTLEEAAAVPLLAHLDRPLDLTVMPAMEPGTAAAGQFRHLRVTLEARAVSSSPKVVVAGIAGGDVDVWVGANAALALAGVGRRVLLVDGRMGERFGTPLERGPDTPGLYDVLLGAELERAVSPGPVDRLQVLPAGTYGDAAVQELIARRFQAVMDAAAASFDDIVVIGPPLEVCDDSRAMAADGWVVLALMEGSVAPGAVRAHADRLRASGANLLGAVLVGRRSERLAV